MIAAFGSVTDAVKAAVAADTLAINGERIVMDPPYKRLVRKLIITEDIQHTQTCVCGNVLKVNLVMIPCRTDASERLNVTRLPQGNSQSYSIRPRKMMH